MKTHNTKPASCTLFVAAVGLFASVGSGIVPNAHAQDLARPSLAPTPLAQTQNSATEPAQPLGFRRIPADDNLGLTLRDPKPKRASAATLDDNMSDSRLILCLAKTSGPSESSTNSDAAGTDAEDSSRPLYRPWTVAVEGGSAGFGALVSWRFMDHLGVRAGFDGIGITEDQDIKDINYHLTTRLLTEPLTLDIYPWKKHSFHASVGVQFNQNEVTGTANVAPTVTLDGQTFAYSSVGDLNVKIHQQLVNPYAGIGGNFLYFDHAHHWAFGGELGVAYTGDPSVSLTRSGPRTGTGAATIDAALNREQARIQDWSKQWSWLPVLKLNVSYSF